MSASSGTNILRAAIIGAGGVARTQHAPALARLDGVKIAAVCDIDEARAKDLAAQYGASAYTDYERMLADVRPDIVHVCTPEANHYEPVIASLEAGAHVFCEKVMAESVEKARAMVAKALELGRLLGVNYNYRFMPAFRKLKEMIEAGELGRIALINVYAHSYCMHHAIDLVRFLAGEVVEAAAMHTRWDRPEGALPRSVGDLVYCPTRNEGIVLRLDNGAVATLSGSLYMDLNETMVQLECVGEKARVLIDQIQIRDISGRLRVFPEGKEIPLVSPEERAKGFNLAFERSIEAFVRHVREGRAPSPSGVDGLRAVEVEEAVVRSQKERRFVPLSRVAASALAFSRLPLDEALERIARLGVPFVDLAFHEGWAHLFPSQVAAGVSAAIERVKAALSRTGVVPISFNVGLGTSDPDEERRRFAAVAEVARALGVRTLTLPAAPKGTPVEREIERLRRLVDIARPLEVNVTVETHVGQLTEEPAAAAHIARNVPGLGLTLDPSHYYAGPLQCGDFEAVLPFVRHVHLRDAGRSWDEIQLPVGSGRVEFRRLFELLRRQGYTGDFVAEYIDSIAPGAVDVERELLKVKALVETEWLASTKAF